MKTVFLISDKNVSKMFLTNRKVKKEMFS